MRTPTAPDVIYAWHRKAIAGENPEVTFDPQPGYYKRRLVKDAAWVPVEIVLHQEVDGDGELTADERLRCFIGNKERENSHGWDILDEWMSVAHRPITEAEFRYLISLKNWAEAHAPDHPSANPYERVDFNTSPIPF